MLLKVVKKVLNFLFPLSSSYYIHSSDILPAPLDSENELKYVTLAKEGVEEARNKLIEHNLRLVVYIAKKYEFSNVNIQDLISIGSIGLIKGVNTYDVSKNIKLATYASRCIENEILMFLRKYSRIKGEVSLDEPLNVDWDGNELLLSDILGTDDDVILDNIEQDDRLSTMYKFVKKLNVREREIITLRFGLFGNEELTQKEVAEQLGISQSYISRLEKKIIEKLQKQVEKINIS